MSAKKDTNPKDAVGTAKVPISTVSARVMAEVGLAMLEGARKYGRHNFRVAGVRASVYHDAVFRHLAAWWEGQDVDAGSGLSHITKAIAGLMVLRDSMLMENWVDDRPPKTPGDWVEELNAKAKDIIAKYPDAVPAYTALGIAVEHGKNKEAEFKRAEPSENHSAACGDVYRFAKDVTCCLIVGHAGTHRSSFNDNDVMSFTWEKDSALEEARENWGGVTYAKHHCKALGSDPYWACTRKPGHSGEHVAMGSHGRYVRWPSEVDSGMKAVRHG